MSLERFCPLYIDQAFTGTFREDCPVDGQLTEINGDLFAVPAPLTVISSFDSVDLT